MNQAEKKQRLSREAWLQQALDILAEDPEHLRIDELADRLGVSKGSFYWHFENRSEFILAMAEYWRDRLTIEPINDLSLVGGSAEDRLYALMRKITENRLGHYDLAVRAWARHEPSIMSVIRDVDRARMRELNELFLEIGFDEEEARMRARLFVVCHSFDEALSLQLNRKEALKQIDTRHAFFTRD